MLAASSASLRPPAGGGIRFADQRPPSPGGAALAAVPISAALWPDRLRCRWHPFLVGAGSVGYDGLGHGARHGKILVLHRIFITRRRLVIAGVALGVVSAMQPVVNLLASEQTSPLEISWADNFLTVRGRFPGDEIKILYLEAYCRAGSTDRDWAHTVIPHTARQLPAKNNDGLIHLQDMLADGVVVDHVIESGLDEVDFRVRAYNPTDKESPAHWAQPCIRVDRFTGAGNADAHTLVPAYARKCFLFVNDKLTRLPSQPWAEKGRYTPGQVYCPRHVDRNDVNPRPLSELVPSSGLCGCFSADEKMIMAVAWEPYQEIFQGVRACIHSDFRLGGLGPGQRKQVRGKLYIVPADVPKLVTRFKRDFPEQAAGAH
jgi:hypothetical protein